MARSPDPAQNEIPIQPVAQPILCSPYEEPHEHWVYDTRTGAATRQPGRRPASYWYRTDKTGSAQTSLFAEEERDDLPLVNLLRDDVRRWRQAEYRGASNATKELLRHWSRADRPRRLFFAQLEAVETIIYLAELRLPKRGGALRFKPRVSDSDLTRLLNGERPGPDFDLPQDTDFFPTLCDRPATPDARVLRRVCAKLATGGGKTIIMSMLIAWAFVNRGVNPASRQYPSAVLVCCPNLTVKDRLQVLRPDHPDNYYSAFDLVPQKYRPLLQQGRVLVTNWHAFAPESPHRDRGKSFAVVDKGEETPAAFAKRLLGDAYDRMPIMVLNDEGHHCWRPATSAAPASAVAADDGGSLAEEIAEATVWVDGLDRLNSALVGEPGISLCVDMSATPFYIKGSGYPEGRPFPWIVSDFGLVDAIESGLTKIPRLPVQDTTGRPDPRYFRLWDAIKADLQPSEFLPGRARKPKPEAVFREAQGALAQIAGQWKERFDQIQAASPGQDRTPPVLIVVCDNTDIAEVFYRRISGESEVEVATQAEVEEVLSEGGDEAEDGDIEERVGRGKKPKKNTVYGAGDLFPELLSNTAQRKYTIRIDSKLLAEAETGTLSKKKAEAAEALRRVVATVGKRGEPGEHVRCVVSVSMLTEGWDANNVTHILGVRAFGSQLLCEQVVGRGLRRMDYTPDPATGRLTEEYADVYGIPFSVIPFRGRPVNKPEPDDKPKNHVHALEERGGMEMRFPIVEGYAFALKRGVIRCDIGAMETLIIEPNREPTGTFIRAQVGYQVGGVSQSGMPFGFEEQDREEFYKSTHLQAILFEASRRIVTDFTSEIGGADAKTRRVLSLQSRHALFPQVYRIVAAYVDRKVNWNGANPAELGLQKYMERLVERVRDAIKPDDSAGEPPLLPLLNRYREFGTTADVNFKTTRPCFATVHSHINQVVADTQSWEQSATYRLEQAATRGAVRFYARNDGLGLAIPYEYMGVDHSYEPDFLVRLHTDPHEITLVLEVKGFEDDKTKAKHGAAKRWVEAVNNWGKLGRWDFHVCRNPQLLDRELEHIASKWRAAAA